MMNAKSFIVPRCIETSWASVRKACEGPVINIVGRQSVAPLHNPFIVAYHNEYVSIKPPEVTQE